jgi:hypothetical protein
MPHDIAGVPCRDLNRPADIRCADSLDDDRRVLSNQITERCTVLCDAAAAIALPSLLQLVMPMMFMLVPVMVLLLVFVMMLLPPLPPLLTNHCRCSRLRAQGVTDRQHITALIRLCNATPAKPQA